MNIKNLHQRAFTLIELLVVIAVISLLTSVVLAALQEAREKALASKITQEMLQLKNALEIYRTANGTYPNDLNQLIQQEYISQISFLNNPEEVGTIYPDSSSVPIFYTPNPPYVEEGGMPYYNLCGGKQIPTNGYIIAFYSDKKINLPTASFYWEYYGMTDNAFYYGGSEYGNSSILYGSNVNGYVYCISSEN